MLNREKTNTMKNVYKINRIINIFEDKNLNINGLIIILNIKNNLDKKFFNLYNIERLIV